MASFGSIAWSSVGKKVITGITGFLLIGFILVHLLGNLTLFLGPGPFNGYAHFLEGIFDGWFVILFELGLLAIFVFHMAAAVTVAWLDKRAARKQGYKYSRNAGGKSRKTLASRSMIYSGALIIVFVIGHVWMFKFGGHLSGGHEIVDGTKNLYRTVVDAFKQPGLLIAYEVIMILIGVHLWHGFWSAFQSMGWANDRYLPLIVNVGRVVAVVLAIGFLILPLYCYFALDPGAVAASSGGH